MSGTQRSFYGIATNTTELVVATDFAIGTLTHVLIYTKSSFAEQSTPQVFALADAIASVSGVSFVDRDLDIGDLGDTITWNAPIDASKVTRYNVYFAVGLSGADRSQVGMPVDFDEYRIAVDENTSKLSYTHVVVYTQSYLTEQTTPVGSAIYDAYFSASSIQFADKDLDVGSVAGVISWTPSGDVSLVTQYMVYIGIENSSGFPRSGCR